MAIVLADSADDFTGRRVYFGQHLAAAQFACIVYVEDAEYIVTASLTPLLFTSANFLSCFSYDCSLHGIQHEEMTDVQCKQVVAAAVDSLLAYVDLTPFPIAHRVHSFGIEVNRELLLRMQAANKKVKDVLPFTLHLRPTKEAFREAVTMLREQMKTIDAAIKAGIYSEEPEQAANAFPAPQQTH